MKPRWYPKADCLSRLARLTRCAGRPVRSDELPHRLYESILHHHRTLAAARRAAGLAAPTLPRRWSKERVLEEIRRLHRSGVKITQLGLADAGRSDLSTAIRKHVGSVVRARSLARVPHPRRARKPGEPWDEDRVTEEILARHRRGLPLSTTKVWRPLLWAGCRLFESWRQAIATAGLDYDEVRLVRAPYTEAVALRELRALAAEEPGFTLGDLHAHPLARALHRLFGSVERALEAANLVDWPRRLASPVRGRRDTLRLLKERHAAGSRMGLHATAKEDPALVHSATRAFGSWRDAMRAAGLEATQRRTWTRQTILAELQRRRAQGLPLHASAVEDDLPGLYAAASRVFGSYARAARRFGKLAARPVHRRWSKETVIQEIQRRARKGRLPEGALRGALTSACQEVFGSVSAARIAAGLPGLTKWSPERVRREIRRLRKGGVASTPERRALRKAARRIFGSWKKACDGAG